MEINGGSIGSCQRWSRTRWACSVAIGGWRCWTDRVHGLGIQAGRTRQRFHDSDEASNKAPTWPGPRRRPHPGTHRQHVATVQALYIEGHAAKRSQKACDQSEAARRADSGLGCLCENRSSVSLISSCDFLRTNLCSFLQMYAQKVCVSQKTWQESRQAAVRRAWAPYFLR